MNFDVDDVDETDIEDNGSDVAGVKFKVNDDDKNESENENKTRSENESENL